MPALINDYSLRNENIFNLEGLGRSKKGKMSLKGWDPVLINCCPNQKQRLLHYVTYLFSFFKVML